MNKFIDNLSEEEINKIMMELYDFLFIAKNREEVKLVFRDLLTHKERISLHKRIMVAFLLYKGFSFSSVINQLGVGTQKITNIAKSMERHGEGFEIIFKQLEKIKIKRKKQELKNQGPIKGFIRNKYKGAFLLLDLLDEVNYNEIAKNKIKEKFTPPKNNPDN